MRRSHSALLTRSSTAIAAALIVCLTFTVQVAVGGGGSRPTDDWEAVELLTSIAADATHGWSGDKLPITTLESDLARGERIVASCGTMARLGVRAARRAGYQARMVAAFTRRPLKGDDGHIMMEVKLNEGWTVFDLDNNRMALPGVGISELVQNPSWLLIADDRPYSKKEIAASTDLPPSYYYDIFRDLDAWYRRVLGVPMIFAHGAYWFHDPLQRTRGLRLGERWASGAQWKKLNR
jgi:hypothetical protein